ncbi:short/branched chain specific acyl-CoA dehydrogenase, mitochondrial-like [Culicoides brevitarsis]|uniref:short/branched chain specific acyl-CoA dehydrogenase, mitochondrial-like n=1 Tax=Culicoides brevitarsis TaxID=469753 RepID=UPI00307B9EA3
MLKNVNKNLLKRVFGPQNVRFCCQSHEFHPTYLQNLTEDEKLMKETVRKFAQEQIAPLVKQMEKEEKIDSTLLKAMFDNGFMGTQAPEEYGGSASNFMVSVLTIEEISKVDAGVAGPVDIQSTLMIPLIKKLGTKAQKDKYLPRLAQDTVGSFALSETSSGSDAFAMKTTAKKDGNYYILNGSKCWISHSDIAEIFIVFVNADPAKGHKGITAFIVERGTEGFTIGKKISKLGGLCSNICEIHFENCRVPEENILGEFGQGYRYAAEYLNEGRVGIAAQMVGLAQGTFDATIPYLLERKQFGKDLFSFQGMQHQIARISTQIEAARLLTYNACRLVDSGKPFLKEASMAKYFASEVAQEATIKCIDWMGGVGFTKDFPQEKFYRDVKAGSIYEGTTNIQLNTIAKVIKNEYKS